MNRDKKLTLYLGILLLGVVILLRILGVELVRFIVNLNVNLNELGILCAFIAITVGTVGAMYTAWTEDDEDDEEE